MPDMIPIPPDAVRTIYRTDAKVDSILATLQELKDDNKARDKRIDDVESKQTFLKGVGAVISGGFAVAIAIIGVLPK
jgi:hypothetical protein